METKARPCGVIIFGASGDLSFRKLIPSLYRLYCRGLLPETFYVLGCARTKMTDDEFRDKVKESLKSSNINKITCEKFISSYHYLSGNYDDINTYTALSEKIKNLNDQFSTTGNQIFYLSTPPSIYQVIIEKLSKSELFNESGDKEPWTRIIVEKPFGYDLKSALKLDKSFHKYLKENQIYRIDHYLGKETVQNILIFRFANSIFEPIWNRNYIDHVQITVAESIGVGHRAGYFDKSGLLRDMFQNHMIQMLSLVAMEPPISFHADHVRDQKAKLLESIVPFKKKNLENSVVRAQYTKGNAAGESLNGYTDEPNVPAESSTETYTAMKIMIDNWRWQGVPFYVRSGKRLPVKSSEIAVVFKKIPHSIFTPIKPDEFSQNALVFNVQPEEGIELTIQAKHPGPKLCMSALTMDFKWQEIFGTEPPEAYERLLLDCMLGDQTLFIRHDNMKLSWSLFTPVLDKWADNKDDLDFYEAGSQGPPKADQLLKQNKHAWREI